MTDRMGKILQRRGRIVLKSASGWYLGSWTNIAAGFDSACWGQRRNALEMFDLEWAHAIAKLYKCKVVVVYPKRST